MKTENWKVKSLTKFCPICGLELYNSKDFFNMLYCKFCNTYFDHNDILKGDDEDGD